MSTEEQISRLPCGSLWGQLNVISVGWLAIFMGTTVEYTNKELNQMAEETQEMEGEAHK